MNQTWERPYTPGGGRWLVIGWEVVALALLGWTTVRKFDLSGAGIRVLVVALALTWGIGAIRILRMGVYVSLRGVQVRGLLRSRTVGWAGIAHFRLHKARHRIGPWEIESGLTVLIERVDGSTVNTELWAQGVDFHRRPSAFRALYHELRSLHLAAVSGL